LFTVLIAEQKYIDSIRQKNKLFFDPFLENKNLAFCYWNTSGQNLTDSVPGLLDVVGRHKEWRAVIVNSCEGDSLMSQNPFDVVDYSDVDSRNIPNSQPDSSESWDKWEKEWIAYYAFLEKEKENIYKSAMDFPLQKLATWLCFQPEDYILNEVQEKQDVLDWAMEKISGDHIKPSAKLEQLERKQYKSELRMKENIRRDFVAGKYLDIAYPAEVYCVSPRTADSEFFDPDVYWNVRRDDKYSMFTDRNMYFDKMRFMVFDVLPETHQNFRTDFIRFLATILILASNPVPGSAMQPRRLYCLDTKTDDTPLCTLITSYDKKLAATAEIIDNEMEKIRSEVPGELSDKAAKALVSTQRDVAVLLDESYDSGALFADKNYGLSFDCPENEFHKWNSAYGRSKNTLAQIVKQQNNSIRKAVGRMALSGEVDNVDISRLTPFQIEDIREYVDSVEDEMVSSIPNGITDMAQYTERLEKEAESVKKVIRRRMTMKTTIILGVACLSLFLLCFLPFLIANITSVRAIKAAVGLTGGMLGLLAVFMVIVLFVLRISVKNAVIDYNNTVQAILAEIHASMREYSRYLTAVEQVCRGHAVQNYAHKNVDEYTKSLRIRKKHQEDIRRRRAYLKEDYRDYFGDRTFCDETMSRPYEYDFDQKTEYSYPAPFLAGDRRQIEFISGGNMIEVPSSYVRSILIRMERIYEK